MTPPPRGDAGPTGQLAPHEVDHTLVQLASLVSMRGLCAREAALLAHLPAQELDRISEACHCEACASRRLR